MFSSTKNLNKLDTKKTPTRPKVVVIGSGISGLASSWLLHQSGQYDVTLLEADKRFGGHAHAVPVAIKENNKGKHNKKLTNPLSKKTTKSALVDTGFLVFNHKTYPHLTHFFYHLGVKIAESDMSFGLSVLRGRQRIEWSGTGLKGVFAQKRRLLSKGHWRMLYDIVRMQKQADKLLSEAKQQKITLDELLKKHNYSTAFVENYLLPMAAAIWSTSVDDIRDFPAETFLTFCKNHVLLDIAGRPQWQTVDQTSAQYVNKVIAALPDARANHKVTQIIQKDGKHLVQFSNETEKKTKTKIKTKTKKNSEIVADIVVFACHTDTASHIAKHVATKSQMEILNAIKYSPNTAYLHTDKQHMPKNKQVWSSWNYLARYSNDDGNQSNAVTISYWINKLQPFVPFNTNVFVTLNPLTPIKKSKVLQSFSYDHPQMNQDTIDAQTKLPIVQGDNNLYFAGAWTRYGFHEDGILSAVNVAKSLGVETPWQIPGDWDENYAIHAERLATTTGASSNA